MGIKARIVGPSNIQSTALFTVCGHPSGHPSHSNPTSAPHEQVAQIYAFVYVNEVLYIEWSVDLKGVIEMQCT